jgi:hypothetical protein
MTINPDNYYIFDCNGQMLGNPSGYKTHSAASAQTNRKDATVYIRIWRAFRTAKALNPSFNLVCSIKQGAVI